MVCLEIKIKKMDQGSQFVSEGLLTEKLVVKEMNEVCGIFYICLPNISVSPHLDFSKTSRRSENRKNKLLKNVDFWQPNLADVTQLTFYSVITPTLSVIIHLWLRVSTGRHICVAHWQPFEQLNLHNTKICVTNKCARKDADMLHVHPWTLSSMPIKSVLNQVMLQTH